MKVVPLYVKFCFQFESLNFELCSSSYGQFTIQVSSGQSDQVQEYPELESLIYPSNFSKLHLVLGSGQNIKVVVLDLMKILIFESLHFQFCRPSYGILAKTARIAICPEFLGQI